MSERAYTDAELAENVARGIELLDRERPGWADRIDLSRFDIRDECRCTIGQLFAGDPDARFPEDAYGIGLTALGIGEDEGQDDVAFGFDLRFFAVRSARGADFRALNDEWVRVISERQTGGR